MRKDLRPPSTLLSDTELGYLPIYVRKHIKWLYKQMGLRSTRSPTKGAFAKIGRAFAGMTKRD